MCLLGDHHRQYQAANSECETSHDWNVYIQSMLECCRAFRINVIRDLYEEWVIGIVSLWLFFILIRCDCVLSAGSNAHHHYHRMRISTIDGSTNENPSFRFAWLVGLPEVSRCTKKKVSYITSDDCCEWCFVRQRQPTTDGRMMGQRGLVRFEKWQNSDFTNTHRTRVVMGWCDGIFKNVTRKTSHGATRFRLLARNDRKGNIKFNEVNYR